MLVLLSGVSGAGKDTVKQELKELDDIFERINKKKQKCRIITFVHR